MNCSEEVNGGLWVLTFGSREEKVIGAVDAENSFAVSLRHVDALQRRRPTALGGRHRVNDAPGKTHAYRHRQQVQGGQSVV